MSPNPSILSEDLKRDLMKYHRELTTEGKLTPKDKMATYYRTFRDRFGPEHLVSLAAD